MTTQPASTYTLERIVVVSLVQINRKIVKANSERIIK